MCWCLFKFIKMSSCLKLTKLQLVNLGRFFWDTVYKDCCSTYLLLFPLSYYVYFTIFYYSYTLCIPLLMLNLMFELNLKYKSYNLLHNFWRCRDFFYVFGNLGFSLNPRSLNYWSVVKWKVKVNFSHNLPIPI